jgi:hypothetical protein
MTQAINKPQAANIALATWRNENILSAFVRYFLERKATNGKELIWL